MKRIEPLLEKGIFMSRWLMAPIYLGLVVSLFLLLIAFTRELFHLLADAFTATQHDIILGVLSLIDLSLAGNLLLIVIFSGYENFVSKMNISHEDRPEWQGTVDFSTLKMKLIASIVAISAIHLLKVFMNIGNISEPDVRWLVIIHVVFVVSGVLLALMDRISASTKALKKK